MEKVKASLQEIKQIPGDFNLSTLPSKRKGQFAGDEDEQVMKRLFKLRIMLLIQALTQGNKTLKF